MLPDINQNNDDWQVNVRSDMWNDMNMHQLNTQLELILTKISLLGSMPVNDPTVQSIGIALQRAVDYLTVCMNSKVEPNKRNKM